MVLLRICLVASLSLFLQHTLFFAPGEYEAHVTAMFFIGTRDTER